MGKLRGSRVIRNKPRYLYKREEPDNELLAVVKRMMNERKSVSCISRELGISTYKASNYYWHVIRGKW